MLKQRILTALILVPLAIAAIFFLSLPNLAAALLVVLAIGAWEWGPLMGFDTKARRTAFVSAVVLCIIGLWTVIPVQELWTLDGRINPLALNVLYVSAAWWLVTIFMIFKYPRYSSFWTSHRSIRGLFGILTLAPTWLAFLILRSNGHLLDEFHGTYLLLLLFAFVWSADIGAYFAGKRFGKNKLMPNVSPGKTIEGVLGGNIAAALVAVVTGLIYSWSSQQIILAIALALVISIVSVVGDLTESMLKRQAGVKDSGSILPGHGGILDRIDSLTATAPVFALCFVLFGW
ncbi:phosphatidate cytidylyltransferase [Thalassotalea fonticola]|uniref:Phosphatidate cytidylyltransferase n=1 Tax=Thalassotalea fonticola TaxID=3065649 RepID=A0ABZ0GS41_9GAMM|nr:phosphatidate cytidylyltransferase [Colwelliaceae bacterium S1-1]